MSVTQHEQPPGEHQCPGEQSPITRAIHLARLARFYPACRRCPHRDDTGTLPARQVRRLEETRRRGESHPLFHAEGAAGVYRNQLDPALARQMAAALGVYLRRTLSDANDPPVAVVAGDGRPLAAEMVAAASEGLRWAGCHLVDVGPATSPCLAFTISHLECHGGILVGNPTGRTHTVGLKFWARGPSPLSEGHHLDALRQIVGPAGEQLGDCPSFRVAKMGLSPSGKQRPLLGQTLGARLDRPTRQFGSPRRFQAQNLYLDTLAHHYHALRPLRLVLATDCRPVVGYLEKLTAGVACEVIPCRGRPEQLTDRVRAERAHFAVRIDDDGEQCRLVDERGRQVPSERLLLLLARHLMAEQSGSVIVLEEETHVQVAQAIRGRGGHVLTSAGRRAAVHEAMRESQASFGGGPSGRFWYRSEGDHVAPDALMTLTLLLTILSQSDRPLSAALDEQAALG